MHKALQKMQANPKFWRPAKLTQGTGLSAVAAIPQSHFGLQQCLNPWPTPVACISATNATTNP
ncbi:MAG: hypothetical protein JSS79_05815 [Bacteroidetes bacterium]|nr:hypothetical protein [Bacteroidota bacterium]